MYRNLTSCGEPSLENLPNRVFKDHWVSRTPLSPRTGWPDNYSYLVLSTIWNMVPYLTAPPRQTIVLREIVKTNQHSQFLLGSVLGSFLQSSLKPSSTKPWHWSLARYRTSTRITRKRMGMWYMTNKSHEINWICSKGCMIFDTDNSLTH